MQEEQSEYKGRVLPGSRWLQRAFQGHVDQEVTVLRVGARSVMLVIEGFVGPNGGKGSTHDRRKVGQKFNVVLETFLRTHTLISQPKGYKPGDELDPPTAPATTEGPKVDAVETFFKRRQYAADWLANMSGKDIRVAATDPDFPVLTGPQRYTGDVVIPIPPKEEPVQNAQAEPTEPPEDIVPEEQRRAVEVLAASITRQPSEPPPPTAVQAEMAPQPEVDPLDAFLDNGRAVVARLSEELSSKQQQRDEVAGLLASLDTEIAGLTRRRDKADSAVEAAIAAVLGEPEPPDLEEVVKLQAEMPTQAGGSEIEVRPSTGGTTRLAGPMGYVPRPGKLSQRQWILDRFVRDGKLTIQEVVDEFVAEYGMPREAGIKNISSIMHHQIKNPSDQWPVPYRIYQGNYAVPTDLRQGRI